MLIIRHIATHEVPVLDEKQKPLVVDGQPVMRTEPVRDEHGADVELWSVDIPRSVEAEGAKAIDAYVALTLAARAAAATTDQAVAQTIATDAEATE